MDVRTEDSIGDRLRIVVDRIARAARSAGRGKDVKLVAATKMVSPEQIRTAIEAGLRFAGENRLQEALPKIRALQGLPIRWHFIGQLQRRKVRDVVGAFDLIHSVDSVELAYEINRRAEAAGFQQDILVEVNVGEEPTKAGFNADRLEEIVPELGGLTHIRVRGLMTIPPQVDDPERARPYFSHLRRLVD